MLKIDERKIPKVRDEVVLLGILVWNFYTLNRIFPYLPESIPVVSLGGRLSGQVAKSWWAVNSYAVAAAATFLLFSAVIALLRRPAVSSWAAERFSRRYNSRHGEKIVKAIMNGFRYINAAAVVLLSYIGYGRSLAALGIRQGLGLTYWIMLFFLIAGITLFCVQLTVLLSAARIKNERS